MKEFSYELSLLLTSIASLSTLIGAALPSFIKPSNIFYLVFALAFSGGAMAYISFVEMIPKALNHFNDTNINSVFAQSLFFAIGIFICGGLDYLINKINNNNSQSEIDMNDYIKNIKNDNKSKDSTETTSLNYETQKQNNTQCQNQINNNVLIKINSEEDSKNSNMKISFTDKSKSTLINLLDNEDDFNGNLDYENNISSPKISSRSNSETLKCEGHFELRKVGILTAVVITINNIPEGVASFTSNLSDINMGLILTIAIAIHNIPEGLCVAFPIYYSTGSVIKAFIWGAISGLSELATALTEYVILKLFKIEVSDFTPMVYGIIYSVISGIMIYISLCELLPSAIRYDNNGNTTRIGFISGMLVMAISLIFLNLI